MTISFFFKIAVSIAIAVAIVVRWQNRKSALSQDMEHIRTSDWGGWIEIANTDYLPLFQGKIVAYSQDPAGALLFGVLVEANAPPSLMSAIKAGPFTYLTDGRVLVRGMTAHQKKLIMTKLEDRDLIKRLCAIMDQGVKPGTCLALNSIEIQHVDTQEGMTQFEKIWQDAQAQTA